MRSLTLPVLTALIACSGPTALAIDRSTSDSPLTPPETTDPLSDLSAGWNTIKPLGDTICSDGSDYQFFVRPGDPDKLLVFFQGGGACWNGATCDPLLRPTYKTNVRDDEPARYHGIFAFDVAGNPFSSHSVVFAPYCTGDAHIGDSLMTYQGRATEERPSREFQIHHRGYVNGDAVLDWTYDHFAAPASIFVTGSSGGAIPTPYYTMRIAAHYAESKIAQLGDGAGGYRSEDGPENPATAWNTSSRLTAMPEFSALTDRTLRNEDLYIGAATAYPEIMFAAYDTAEDVVQRQYLRLWGAPDGMSLRPLLDANQTDIRAQVENFRSYIAGGELHTILGRPEFYTYTVGDVSVREWVARLSRFEDVDNITCTSCAEAEVITASRAPEQTQ